MKFKEPHMERQLAECPADLMRVARYADFLSRSAYGKELVITRVSDPVAGESGVHLAKRAFDVRIESSAGRYYTFDEAEYIRTAINDRFRRKDHLLTCVVHSFNGGMEHFHFQIPADPKLLVET